VYGNQLVIMLTTILHALVYRLILK
jgi:hypothetical protein